MFLLITRSHAALLARREAIFTLMTTTWVVLGLGHFMIPAGLPWTHTVCSISHDSANNGMLQRSHCVIRVLGIQVYWKCQEDLLKCELSRTINANRKHAATGKWWWKMSHQKARQHRTSSRFCASSCTTQSLESFQWISASSQCYELPIFSQLMIYEPGYFTTSYTGAEEYRGGNG